MRSPRYFYVLLVGCFCCWGFPASLGQSPDDSLGTVDFATEIWPLLETHCLDCHGPDTQESHLRVDSLRSLQRGGDSGEPAIDLQEPKRSLLLTLVAHEDDAHRMPPQGSERLSATEIDQLSRWLQGGADWDTELVPEPDSSSEAKPSDHWAFQPLVQSPLPSFDPQWIKQPLDAWVDAERRQAGLSPNPEAGRATLIRRLYLDLLGLPPSPEQVASFVADPSPLAYENLVESLLADPHFGERWARYWLDLVRFAETDGFETNRERPNAWHFRDYIIGSINEDKPYDQLIREHLAGDAIGVPLGTGFLVAGTHDIVKSPDINLTLMQRQNELDDMLNTTGTTFLGLTVGCARCHNHKFDPITQRDYYALQAIFAGTQHGERALPIAATVQEQLHQIDNSTAQLRKELSAYQVTSAKLRPAVDATANLESFAPVEARWLRMTISATNSGEPCIDELEVYSQERNVALASEGTRPTSSSALPGYPIHQLRHVNDGKHGNSHSWISNEPGRGWVQLEFVEPFLIDSIRWARDKEGRFGDRLATEYRFEVSMDGEHWHQVCSSADREAFGTSPIVDISTSLRLAYDFTMVPAQQRDLAEQSLAKLIQLEQRKDSLLRPQVAYVGTFEQPGPTYRLFRGEPQQPREQVKPDTIESLGQLDLSEQSNERERRLTLANWLVDDTRPLVARVIVNRIWQHHFGQGIVPTPSDFGMAGVPPTHPELLDFLAGELIRNEWSLKKLHRTILLSATYRQSSAPREECLEIDGSTRLLWRYPPRRLEAEPLRDSILAVAGTLDVAMGGPGFSAFEVELENVRHYHPKQNYGPADWRRMIYMTKVRQEQDSVFGIFDCPDAATSVPARNRSTTPLQSLNLFNSGFVQQQAENLAKRLLREAKATGEGGATQVEDPSKQVHLAYRLCFAREASTEEIEDASEFIKQHGLASFCRALLNSNEFMFLP
jgi:hypothetical protein